MTELGGGVDKFEVDLLLGTTACLHQQRLEGERTRIKSLYPRACLTNFV